MFSELIKKVVEEADGIGGLIMGLDGIAIDHYVSESRQFDINTVGMEFSYVIGQARKAGEILELGNMTEMVIKSEGVTLLFRMLSKEYFLGIVMPASGNFGRTRFLMRKSEAGFRAEL